MRTVQQQVPPPVRGAAGDHDRRPVRTLTADRLAIPRGELLLTPEISHADIVAAGRSSVNLAAAPLLMWFECRSQRPTVKLLAAADAAVIVACVIASEGPDEVPERVLAAFGLAGTVPVRLTGGQGTAWRAGQVVLKPADSVRAGRWFAEVYDTVSGTGFRVPRPVRALTGDWVAHGWTCHQWVPGTAADWSGVSPRWPEMVAASRALHAALARVSVPSWRARVENPWTIGDEVAWGERDPGPLLGPAAGPLQDQVRRLLAALRPVDLPAQLIHADLAGNVLFAEGLPPAVIDFSPLERPAGLPLAIVAVDALQWHRARPEVLEYLAGEPELDQLLVRALLFRQVTVISRRAGTDGVHEAARTGEPVTSLILSRVAPGSATAGGKAVSGRASARRHRRC